MSSPRANSHARCVRMDQQQSVIRQLIAAVLIYLTALTPLSSFGAEPTFPGPAVRYSSGSSARGPQAATRATSDSSATARNSSRNGLPTLAALAAPEPMFFSGGGSSTPTGVTIFGPKQYLRTSGPPNDYVDNVTVPAWLASPFDLHIENGQVNGCNRISAAWISINGVQVAGPSDFNQQVFVLDRTVNLTPTTTLEVKLASGGGGDNDDKDKDRDKDPDKNSDQDRNPSKKNSTASNSESDSRHEGDKDQHDQDKDRDKKDHDRNDGQDKDKGDDDDHGHCPSGAYLTITLFGTNADHTSPQITVMAPAPGSTVNTATPHLAVQYADLVGNGEPAASGVNTSTLAVTLDGVDRTSLFTKTATGATADLPQSLALTAGAHTLAASVQDFAGNTGHTSAQFTVSLQPPQVQVAEPVNGSYINMNVPAVRVLYQGPNLDLSSLQVLINGVDRTSLFTKGANEADATLTANTALPNGSNKIVASLKNTGGSAGSDTSTFTVDTVAPVIAINQPANNSHSRGPSVNVGITYSDDQALDLTTFQATLDGAPLSLSTTATGATGTTPSLADGSHTLNVSIKDKAGNPATASVTFFTDSATPNIHMTAPLNGSFLAATGTHVNVTYSDPDLNLSTFKVTLNGADITSSFTVGANSASADLTGLGQGANTLSAQISDLAGNTGHDSSTFTVDTVPPVIAINQPANNSHSRGPSANIGITYSDDQALDLTTFQATLDGSPLTLSTTATGATGTTSSLADGSHTLSASIKDKAGNPATASITFFIDNVAPNIHITAPVNGSFVAATSPHVNITFADPDLNLSTFKVTSNGTDITSLFTVTPNSASADLTGGASLGQGANTLTVQISDLAGNTGHDSSTFTVDTTPPQVTIVQPADGSYTNQQTIAVSGTVADDTPVTLQVNGVSATINGNQFTATVPLPTEGLQALQAVATDAAGNVGQASINIHVDRTPPVVVIAQPLDGSYTNQQTIVVSGTVTDASPVTVQVEGASATMNGNQFTATVPLPTEGLQSLQVVAADAAGNVGQASINIHVDRTPPVVVIAQPPDGSYTNQQTIVVSGTVTDTSPITVQVQGVSATVSGNQFTTTVPLPTEGLQNLQAVATDAAGNVGQVSINIHVDRTPPVVTIAQPSEGSYSNQQTIAVSGTVTDASPVTVQVQGVSATVNGTQFTASVPLSAEGLQTLQAVATDAAGNVGQASVNVHVDRTPPLVKIFSPQAGAYIKGPVITVTGSVADASPTMTDVNAISTMLNPDGTFSTQIPVVDGPLNIIATSHDAAGNVGTAQVPVIIDSVPPVITVTTPQDGLITNQATQTVQGTVTDAAPVTLTINGSPAPVTSGAFSQSVTMSSDGPNTITLVATDAAGNVSTKTIHVTLDRTPPTLSIAAPSAGAVLGSLPVIVQGTVQDDTATTVTVDGIPATATQNAWQLSVASLPDGPHTFLVVATDAAGNSTQQTESVLIATQPPTIVITAPASGSLTRNTSIPVNGTVTSPALAGVQVNGVAAAVQPSGDGLNATFSVVSVPLNPGDNQLVATATDVLSRSGQATVLVTQDSIPPVIELTTPTSISKLHPGQFTVAVTDNIAVAQFVVSVNGSPLGTFTSSPYQATLSVPSGAVPGDTVTVAVTAADTAGNTATDSRGVSVVADGVVVGQVLSDVTGLPLPGVNVSIIGSSQNATTDDQGRYSLPANDAQIFLLAQADPNSTAGPMTAVERQVAIQSGVGTVPIDARLTPLASSTNIDATGGTLAAGTVSISVPAGAVGASTPFQLTGLSPQGLPGLLPLGWSPLVSFDLRAGATTSASLNAAISKLPAQQTLHLVTYHPTVHSWVMVAPNLATDASGNLALSLPGVGAYSLVQADQLNPPITISGPGEVLIGTAMVLIPSTATTTSLVSPPSLPPTGGTAVGSLALQSSTPLPSGTVVQAATTETFNLTSGQVASEEQRLQDVLLFQVPVPTGASLAAQFPITPSKTFENGQLSNGDVHLDILAGRESVRGQVGGNDALTLSDGNITFTVGAGSLAHDTDMSIAAVALSFFDPTSNGLTPLAEVVVDLSGQILNTSAELSAAATGVSPADTLLIARVQRVNDVPYLTVVALGALQNGTIVSTAYPGLPGIKQEGRYVFYKSGSPVGFVAGVTSSTAGPVKAVVRTDSLPFISFSGLDGSYIVPALPGSANLQAQVPDTSLQGSASSAVTAGQTANLNIALTGATTTATVTPADGTTAVSVATQIEITTSAPVKPASITTDNIKLFQGAVANNQVVPVRFVLSVSGNSLAVIPQAALLFATQYTLQASGLADVFGGSISVPTVTFTTATNTPPVYDTSKITFSFPDSNGNVTVLAPPGSLAPGSTVLIIDATNGVVASFTVLNDGSLNGQFLATINDILQVTITDPHGNVTTFTSGQFVAPDGTVAVGPGGGTINGPNGTALIVPAGALDQAITFKLDTFDSTLFPDTPDADNLQFGSGLKVHVGTAPVTFNQPLSLVFPRPAGTPDNAQYYVYRRVVQPDGSIGYEVIDNAELQPPGTSVPGVIARGQPSSFELPGGSSGITLPPPPEPFEIATTHDLVPLPGYGLSGIADNYFIVMWFVDDL
ncbi:MAG TPA: Ig-like domain repeat protein, partial [Terriglobales bacterium]|nr:Ig-like domain repeat protein [Terriglobales bacterium]